MKPKRQEDSSCVFAYRFCRGTCHRRDTAGKESAPKSLWRRSGKEVLKKPLRWHGTTAIKGEASSRPCMPQSECGAGHTGYRAFLIRRRADHRTPAEPSAAEFSGMVSATAPSEQGIFAPCGSVLTQHKERETDAQASLKNHAIPRLSACGSLSVLRRYAGNGSPCQRVKCVHLNTTTTTRSFFI